MRDLNSSTTYKYHVFNFIFHFIHLFVVFLTVFGWLFATTRDLYLWTQVFVLLSWFGVGFFLKNYGVCILTEWHRKWKKRFGYNFPKTYIQYLFQRLKIRLDEKYIGPVIFGYYFTTLFVSIILRFF